MDGQSPEELIRKHLVVDESEIFKGVIERAKRVLLLDSGGGVHLVGAKSRYSARQLFLIYLLGKRLASTGKLSENDWADTSGLSAFLGVGGDVISARASELKQEGFIEAVSRGRWRVSPHRVEEILSDLESAPRGTAA